MLVITRWHDAAHVLLNQLRMLLNRIRNRAENHACLGQLLPERRRHRHRIKHRIHRHAVFGALHAREDLLLLQRNAKLFVRLPDGRVDVIEAIGAVLKALRGGVIIALLVINRLNLQLRPIRLRHLLPLRVRLQALFQHPVRLLLLRGDKADDILIQALGRFFDFDIGDKTGLILSGHIFHGLDGFCRNIRHILCITSP